jgi:spermidine synthase
VSVVERDYRAILINGKAVASDHPSDVQHEFLLGHVPILLHRDPKSVLVVGLGAGITAGAVAAHDAVEELKVVEIEPAVVGGAAQFAHVNDRVLEDSRLEIAFQDGRNYLKTTHRKFDVITADPIHPWAYGAGYLYTTQYYQLASERLNHGGVMCQWVPAYELSLENFKSVVGTFVSSFDHTTLWQASNDMVLVGSDAPIQVDLIALGERIGAPAVTRQLARIGLENPLSFLAGFVMDNAGIEDYVKGAILNTDDNLYLEFSSPLSIGTPRLRGNLWSIEPYRANPMAVATNVTSMFASVAEAEEVFRTYQWAKSRAVEAQFVRGTIQQSRDRARTPAVLQRINGQMRSVLRKLPDYAPARIELAAGLAQLGAIQLGSRNPREAARSCREAVELVPENADCHRVLGLAMLQLGEPSLAVEHLETALDLQPGSWITHYQLSAALNVAGRKREALEVIQRGLAIKPGHAGMESLLAHLRSGSGGEVAP